MTHKGKLIVFSAPSGSGKTTIVRYLLQQPELNLAFSVSATSRYKRANEKDGEDYYFLAVDAFKTKIMDGAFLEYEEVYKGDFYGTLKSEITRIWAMGKHVIFDIDVYGGLRIKEQFPQETLSVFVQPPSIEELEKRLTARKTEGKEKIAMRLAKASKELGEAHKFDKIIRNTDLESAKKQAYALVHHFIQE